QFFIFFFTRVFFLPRHHRVTGVVGERRFLLTIRKTVTEDLDSAIVSGRVLLQAPANVFDRFERIDPRPGTILPHEQTEDPDIRPDVEDTSVFLHLYSIS